VQSRSTGFWSSTTNNRTAASLALALENGFLRDVLRSETRLVVMKVPNTTARCDFEGLPSGTYALVVLHDENMNGTIDANWLRCSEHLGYLPLVRRRTDPVAQSR
jgi:uncharacterized protein (DUF2141 family)